MAPLKDKFTIHSRAVVCQDVEMRGDITIGAGTVVHPKATIFALAGPIVIGMNCILEEGTLLVNRRKEVMRVGDDNLFEIHCKHWSNFSDSKVFSGVEAPSVGNSNTIATKARVHHTIRISDYCSIGAGCLLAPVDDETLPSFTVVFGPDSERQLWSGRGKLQEQDLRRKHAEYLRDTLPRFNRLRQGE